MRISKALIATYHYWNSPLKVGDHHIAHELVDMGWDVGYLSSPISPFHLLKGRDDDIRERFYSYKQKGVYDLDERLWSYVPGALLTPCNKSLLGSEWMFRNWYQLSCPNIAKIAKSRGFDEVDLLFIGNANQAFCLDKIAYRKSVFRIADRNDGFKESAQGSREMEKYIASRVDLLIYSAANLEDYVNSLKPKEKLYVPNGVYLDNFLKNSGHVPTEYAGLPHPIVVYVGAMNYWFDYELLNKAAKHLPDTSFVLIGPPAMARQKLRNLPNVHILGTRAYTAIPDYLYNADVGIIPFDVKAYPELINSVNPLKLYEYMACGLPVVAARWDELLALNSPAILYTSLDAFISGLKQACSMDSYRNDFVEYAMRNGWKERVREMLNVTNLTGGSIYELQLELTGLCVILDNLLIELMVDGGGKLDMPALRSDFTSHLAAGQQCDDITAT